jgi:hypothetical protein
MDPELLGALGALTPVKELTGVCSRRYGGTALALLIAGDPSWLCCLAGVLAPSPKPTNEAASSLKPPVLDVSTS